MNGHEVSKGKQLATLLAGLDRTFRGDFKRSKQIPHNLTLAQYQVISMVAERGQCAQKEIAENLGVTGPTVVRIIDALERKELVHRTRHERDRRIVLVALTDRGVEVQRSCEAMQEQRLASMIERLPSTTADALLVNLSDLLSVAGAQ